jgi:hypothetical protein
MYQRKYILNKTWLIAAVLLCFCPMLRAEWVEIGKTTAIRHAQGQIPSEAHPKTVIEKRSRSGQTIGKKKIQPEQLGGYRVSVLLNGFDLETKQIENKAYDIISVPRWAHQFDNVGDPQVPFKRLFLEIPQGYSATVTVEEKGRVDVPEITLMPAQQLPPDGIEDWRPTFEKNDQRYRTDALYPSSIVVEEKTVAVRNRRYLELTVAPIRYNPVKKRLVVSTQLELDIVLKPDNSDTENLEGTESMDAILGESMFESAANPDGENDPERFMIIMDDQFVGNTTLNSFVHWKRRKGYIVTVVTTSEINPNGAPEWWEIRDYIQALPAEQYPPFLLVIGDETTDNGVGGLQFSSYSSSSWGFTDYYFALRDNSDFLPDLFHGRIPAENNEQLTVMLSKAIAMDRDTPGAEMFDRIIAAGMIQDYDNYDNVADRLFCETVDYIATYFESDPGGCDYTCYRGIVNDQNMTAEGMWNSGSIVWAGATEIERQIGERVHTTFVTQEDARSVLFNEIDNGVALLQHRDHGWPGGWGTPGFNYSDVDALRNGSRRPLVFSINCSTGSYHVDNNFTVHWLMHSNGGAYAVFAPVDVSFSWVNDWLTHGMYIGLIDDYREWHNTSSAPDWTFDMPAATLAGADGSAKKVGQMVNYGKLYMVENWGEHTNTLRLFHAFGDPEADVHFRAPQTCTVAHPETIPTGAATVTITTGVDSALVCLYSEQLGIHAAGRTVGGEISFPASTSTQGLIEVTVTGFGLRPYMSEIGVLEPGTTEAIFVSNPQAGDVYTAGSSVDVTWWSQGTSGQVDLLYSTDGGAVFTSIVESVSDDGGYVWEIPQIESDNCIVRVVDTDQSVYGDSPLFGVGAPALAVSPSEIIVTVQPGESDQAYLSLSNTGTGDLSYTLDTKHHSYTSTTSDHPDGPSFVWDDISSFGIEDWNLNHSTTSYADVTLNFSFPFFGTQVSSVRVTSSGYISFKDEGVRSVNYPIPHINGAEGVLAFNDDITGFPSTSFIHYWDFGDRFVVQYTDVERSDSNDGVYTFQIVIYPSGEFRYYYLDMNGMLTSATIGVQDTLCQDGLELAFNEPFVTDSLAVSITPEYLSFSPVSGVIPSGGNDVVTVDFDGTMVPRGIYTNAIVVAYDAGAESGEVEVPTAFRVASARSGISRITALGAPGCSRAESSRYLMLGIRGAPAVGWSKNSNYYLLLR